MAVDAPCHDVVWLWRVMGQERIGFTVCGSVDVDEFDGCVLDAHNNGQDGLVVVCVEESFNVQVLSYVDGALRGVVGGRKRL